MKILNAFAGIGGNRKLWSDEHEITAIELDPNIAKIYQDFFPNDTVIVGDAHQYLLEHYQEFDFIWSSPPCPTHSDIRRMAAVQGQYMAMYPDMKLWQEITLLKHFYSGLWSIENVKPYYKPIVPPSFDIDRHYFWSNFYISKAYINKREVCHQLINGGKLIYGYNLSKYKIKNKRQILRNLVNPEIGLHILNESQKGEQGTLF